MELPRALLGDRHANQAASKARHEVDDLRGHGVGCGDEIALVLAILFVDQDDDAASLELGDDVGDGAQRGWCRSAFLGAIYGMKMGSFHAGVRPLLRRQLYVRGAEQPQYLSDELASGITEFAQDAVMMRVANEDRRIASVGMAFRPALPEQPRLANELAGLVRSGGQHQGGMDLGL